MRDNLRQYRAIRDAFTQAYPGEPQGHHTRHVVTRAALISGMVASKRTQVPNSASQVPEGTQPERRLTRFARGVRNDTLPEQWYF